MRDMHNIVVNLATNTHTSSLFPEKMRRFGNDLLHFFTLKIPPQCGSGVDVQFYHGTWPLFIIHARLQCMHILEMVVVRAMC